MSNTFEILQSIPPLNVALAFGTVMLSPLEKANLSKQRKLNFIRHRKIIYHKTNKVVSEARKFCTGEGQQIVYPTYSLRI